MTTDITTEGPVMWQAENPTMRNTAMAQNPAKPVLNNLVTSGQVVCLTCLTTHSGLLPPLTVMVIWDTDDTLSKYNVVNLFAHFEPSDVDEVFFRNSLDVHSILEFVECLIRKILLLAAKADIKCDVDIREVMLWRCMYCTVPFTEDLKIQENMCSLHSSVWCNTCTEMYYGDK